MLGVTLRWTTLLSREEGRGIEILLLTAETTGNRNNFSRVGEDRLVRRRLQRWPRFMKNATCKVKKVLLCFFD